MSKYVEKLLGRGEQIVFETRLHRIVYLIPLVCIALGVGAFAILVAQAAQNTKNPNAVAIFMMFLAPLGLLWLVLAWIRRATTEIAVTSRRIVYKRGWLSRNTVEISFKHIESLDIRQPLLGRMLNYGTVVVRGTGIGVQSIHDVAGPLLLRNAAFDQEEAQSA
jgi:uncharacterized membrane protein YdbT with pleckstrin-like domain